MTIIYKNQVENNNKCFRMVFSEKYEYFNRAKLVYLSHKRTIYKSGLLYEPCITTAIRGARNPVINHIIMNSLHTMY